MSKSNLRAVELWRYNGEMSFVAVLASEFPREMRLISWISDELHRGIRYLWSWENLGGL